MLAFTPPSESDDPGPETRLDVAASTVDRPEYPAVQRRDSMLLDAWVLRPMGHPPRVSYWRGDGGVDARGPSSSVPPLCNVASTAVDTRFAGAGSFSIPPPTVLPTLDSFSPFQLAP
ncbi:hypothetical protein B0H14DRAFT_3503730 [Mycena olivaceomarginata]|nr:hypothetical protein B0H14DRAFT_3503730 [Mycena olivaceomarginata]